MSKAPQKLVLGSVVVAGVVAVAAIADMIVGLPFSQNILMDVMFLIGAGLVIYMGYDTFKDLE
jgi:hypothetical protein